MERLPSTLEWVDWRRCREIFTTAERADTTLQSDSTISQATFITESADGGDVLTADAFRERHAAEQRVLTAEANVEHLAER